MIEQAESLRTGGTSLTFFKNGWKVLDAIGVGDDLRPHFLEIQGYHLYSKNAYINFYLESDTFNDTKKTKSTFKVFFLFFHECLSCLMICYEL